MTKKEDKKLTNHITYRILDDTIYLFQEKENVSDDEFNILFKKLALILEDNDISYINISSKKMEDRKDLYKSLGFILSYYDVNKLNSLYGKKKDKILYKCYGIMNKSDFLDRNKKKEEKEIIPKTKYSYSSGFVANILLLFGGILLLCFFAVYGAISLVK